MAWLEIHQSFPTNKKTLRVASALKMTPESVAGHILKLWLWSLDNAPDGYLPEDKDMLDIVAGCPRDVLVTSYNCMLDVPSFADVLIDKHYIDITSEGWVLHDWDEYAGKLILARHTACERKRKERELKKSELLLPQKRPRDIPVTSSATEHYSTVQNSTVQNTKNAEFKKPKNGQLTANELEAFSKWYQVYPKKKAKAIAEKAWKTHHKNMPAIEVMLEKLEAQKRCKQWVKQNGDFIPYPANYINAGSWDDEITQEENLDYDPFNGE